jgi:hypothetical protein
MTKPLFKYAKAPLDEMEPALVVAKRPFYKYFLNGSSKDMNVDGSTTPVLFSVDCASGYIRCIRRIRFVLHSDKLNLDTLDFRGFGDSGTGALTNGVELYIDYNGSTDDVFLSPIKTLGGFLEFTKTFNNFKGSISSTTDYLAFDLTLDTPLFLHGSLSHKIVIKISDDLTDLTVFRAYVSGYYEVLT